MTTKALDHYANVKDSEATLIEFLEWLETHDVELDFDCSESFPVLDSRKPDRLIDSFLNIDRKQLDVERREMLDGINKKAR